MAHPKYWDFSAEVRRNFVGRIGLPYEFATLQQSKNEAKTDIFLLLREFAIPSFQLYMSQRSRGKLVLFYLALAELVFVLPKFSSDRRVSGYSLKKNATKRKKILS